MTPDTKQTNSHHFHAAFSKSNNHCSPNMPGQTSSGFLQLRNSDEVAVEFFNLNEVINVSNNGLLLISSAAKNGYWRSSKMASIINKITKSNVFYIIHLADKVVTSDGISIWGMHNIKTEYLPLSTIEKNDSARRIFKVEGECLKVVYATIHLDQNLPTYYLVSTMIHECCHSLLEFSQLPSWHRPGNSSNGFVNSTFKELEEKFKSKYLAFEKFIEKNEDGSLFEKYKEIDHNETIEKCPIYSLQFQINAEKNSKK